METRDREVAEAIAETMNGLGPYVWPTACGGGLPSNSAAAGAVAKLQGVLSADLSEVQSDVDLQKVRVVLPKLAAAIESGDVGLIATVAQDFFAAVNVDLSKMSSPKRPHRTLHDIGIPVDDDMWILARLYSEPARTMVVVLHPRRIHGSANQRVFVRSIDEQVYREVTTDIPRPSIAGFAVCPTTPSLYLSVSQWRDETQRGADFDGLYRVELPGTEGRRLPAPVAPQSSGCSDAWVSELLGVSADSRHLHVIAACHVVQGMSGKATYHLATFEISSGELEFIAELPAVFA